MASTQQISSERALLAASSARITAGRDDSALLDEFSRLVDDLVTHVTKPRTGSNSGELLTVATAAPKEVSKEKVLREERPPQVTGVGVDAKSDAPSTETEKTEKTDEATSEAGKDDESVDSETSTPEDVGASEVAVAAAQVSSPEKVAEEAVVVGEEIVEPDGETVVEQDLLDTGAQQSANATKTPLNAKSATEVKTALPELNAAPQVAHAPEGVPEATTEETVAPGDTSIQSILDKKMAAAEAKTDATSKNLKAEITATVSASAPTGAEESATGILLRHAFQAVSKALGIERASTNSQQGPQVGAAQPARATAAPDGDSRQAKLKALPRQAAVRLMERVEQILQEVARSKDGKSVSLKLEPADLGTMRVDVSIRDGVLHARLTPESKPVAAFLQEKAHELQSMLRKLGLNVDSVTVSVRSEEFTMAQGEQNGQGAGKNSLSSDGQGGQTGNNFPSPQNGFSSAGSGLSGKALEDHWVA